VCVCVCGVVASSDLQVWVCVCVCVCGVVVSSDLQVLWVCVSVCVCVHAYVVLVCEVVSLCHYY